ncbi:biotin/lipoyl-binding protein [Phragmitibacter flavus]|uniref:Biotin/lipoyl-binding protein n=1 Tax=Phragmitibacter flavus TaxID=2576071 RepID=A0A5R8KBA9_9BACT|nr:efflux RND transporter periplasmic adaptor subunit [Phragmitibacter flavus]TLD69581.1 biotin/lipoyl-binding protein [Phragmitibacter flavus]
MNWLSNGVRYLTLGLALAGFVGITLVIREVQAQNSGEIPPPPVAPPVKSFESTVAGTGIVEALSENVSIGVPVQGLVTEVMVKVNDKVEKGQPLFKIDESDLQAQMVGLQAAVEVAKARVEVQEAGLARSQDLLDRLRAVPDRRAVSVDELKTREMDVMVAKAQLSASKAEVVSAEAGVRQTELLMERLTVRAPRDGSILQVNIRAGEYASFAPRNAALILGDLENLQVRVDVDEQNAMRVQPGQRAVAYVKGDKKRALPLEFVRVEPFVIPKMSLTGASTERVDTRVLQVIYQLKRPENPTIYVGQQVDVSIEADVR